MRITLLALATFSTLFISNDAEAMLGRLKGQKLEEAQGTKMDTRSSSAPCKHNLRTSSEAPVPLALRAMSTGGEDKSYIPEPGSQHSKSCGIPIPSKSAPGTPIHARRGQGPKDEPTAKSYAPESLLNSSNFLFPMEDLDDKDPRLNPSASVNIVGANQGHRNSKQEEDEELSDTETPTPSSPNETFLFEGPFPNFDEVNLPPTNSPSNMHEYITTSSQTQGRFTVGSAPGRKKTNPNGEE